MKCCVLYHAVIVVLFESLRAEETTESVEAVVGQSVELPCNVTSEKDGDKLNVLAWYKDGSRTAIYSRDLRVEESGTERVEIPRYHLVEAEGQDSLMIEDTQPSDAGLYYCLADFAASRSVKTYVHLVVIEPPQHVWVVHQNGSRVATANSTSNASRDLGPYYVGDTVHLFCVAYGGKPKAHLLWRAGDSLLKNTATPLSAERVRSDLSYGPLRREDQGLVLSCAANNNDRTSPLSVDITLDMLLPPLLVSVRSTGHDKGVARVRTGDPLHLQCRVLGARPQPFVLWRLNDGQLYNLEQNITVDRSQRLLVSEMQLTVTKEHDESHVSCCTSANRRDVEYACADALPLNVVYLPVLKVAVKDELDNNTLAVVKGTNVTLNCSYEANPAVYELIWYHEDEVITKEKAGSLVEPVLELCDVSESDAGEYVCAASNAEGSTTSDHIVIDVTYPPFCVESATAQFGLGEMETLNLTCVVQANPAPHAYRWVIVDDAVNTTTLRSDQPCTTRETTVNVLPYQRPNDTTVSTIFCWGINDVSNNEGTLPNTPCTFVVTDETPPQPPTGCAAVKNSQGDITVTCKEGYDGGSSQKFMFTIVSLDSEKQLLSTTNLKPHFIVQEPSEENYKFVIFASNEKGDSDIVEIQKADIVDNTKETVESVNAIPDITTLTLSLFGGVALLALAACGLVLCAHEKRGNSRDAREPALHAYNTEESNCETYHDSDEGSEYNVKRADSFRRAVTRCPSRNFDVRRSSSFHSARYLNDFPDENLPKITKHSAHCRVHSMQNINRKREMDALNDHLMVHLPPDTNYSVPRPMNTFYTMPRKMRHKLAKELRDDMSETAQNSDGFSLPPPPDEFSTYRPASQIGGKDMPYKAPASYATINKKDFRAKDSLRHYNNVIISPLNTVGLPTISGTQSSTYTYPDEQQDAPRGPSLSTFKSILSSPKESGI